MTLQILRSGLQRSVPRIPGIRLPVPMYTARRQPIQADQAVMRSHIQMQRKTGLHLSVEERFKIPKEYFMLTTMVIIFNTIAIAAMIPICFTATSEVEYATVR